MAPLDPREARVAFLRSFKQLAPYTWASPAQRVIVAFPTSGLYGVAGHVEPAFEMVRG